jgi:hypothetical protein
MSNVKTCHLFSLEPEIWYRCLTETGWSNKVNISNSYSLPSEHPFVYLTNEKAVVAWSEEETAGTEESREIWKGERLLTHPPQDWTTWREVETPYQASDWPVVTANDEFLVWGERILVENELNWEIFYKSPTYGSDNLSNSYRTQSLYASCEWRQTTDGVYLYTAFTEKYEYELEPYIFGVKVRRDEFQPPTIPLYTVYAGSEIPSSYCTDRDGYIAYDNYPVDYDTTELIYKFTGLGPNSKYKINATAYHESSGEWREWIKIDNTAQHQIKYEAGEPKTVEFHVPPATYKDGEVIIEITKIRGDFAMLHLSNLYEFEKKGGSGGPQATTATHLPLGFTLSILPNIISRSARLQYTIPEKQRVTLNLYDIVGRKVVSIAEGVIEPGIYTHNLNSAKLSQGIYFLVFKGEKDVKRQKFLIVK